jgi:hypothetical protein
MRVRQDRAATRVVTVIGWRRVEYVIGPDGAFTLPDELGRILVATPEWQAVGASEASSE